jgi:hypothetical protein
MISRFVHCCLADETKSLVAADPTIDLPRDARSPSPDLDDSPRGDTARAALCRALLPSARRAAIPRSPALRMVNGELQRLLLLARRYPLEAGSGVLVLLFMFLVFAYLGQAMSGRWSPFVGGPRVLAVLYAFWIAASSAMGSSVSQITTEAALGLVEPLFLGTQPVTRVLEMRAIAQLVQGTLFGAALMAAFCLGTGWLPSPAVFVSVLVCLGACHVTTLGIALALSGVALTLKRVGPVLMPVNVLTMWAVIGGPSSIPAPSGLGLALPYASASSALRIAVEHDTISPLRWGLAWIVAVTCLYAGRRVLDACTVACRRSGTVHGY